MLLGGFRGQCVANELNRPLDVDGEAGADVNRQPVEDDPEELRDRVELEIGPVDALALALGEMLGDLHVQLRVPLRPALAESRVRAEHAHDLEVHAYPLRALLARRADDALEAFLEPEPADALLVGARERVEELPLVREVAEDRAAREADRLLELGDR